MDLQSAMDAYKNAYTQYKLTGDASYKTAYENAQQWIETYIQNQKSQLDSNKEFIDAFVQDYSNTNPELDHLQTQFKKLQKESPELQSEYAVNHALYQQQESGPDLTPYYIKGGVLAGILGILAVISLM